MLTSWFDSAFLTVSVTITISWVFETAAVIDAIAAFTIAVKLLLCPQLLVPFI